MINIKFFNKSWVGMCSFSFCNKFLNLNVGAQGIIPLEIYDSVHLCPVRKEQR